MQLSMPKALSGAPVSSQVPSSFSTSTSSTRQTPMAFMVPPASSTQPQLQGGRLGGAAVSPRVQNTGVASLRAPMGGSSAKGGLCASTILSPAAPLSSRLPVGLPESRGSVQLQAGGREPDELPREVMVGLLAAIEPAKSLLNHIPKDPSAKEALIALVGLYLATQVAASFNQSETVGETLKQGALFTQELPKKILEAAQAFQALEAPEIPDDIDTILDTIGKPEGEELGNEYCNLPKNWSQLGEAYDQRVYGDGKKPRIVVDVSNHPDMQAPGCPFENVKYVIKHSDRTGQIGINVVPKSHDITDGSSWYQDLMRDEVQAEFMLHPETCKPFLVFRTHVGKGEHGLGSSAELMLDKMAKWSNHPAWKSLMTNVTKAWLNARLQVFDAHHFHPVESLLEVLDPAFRMNSQWENADIIWVNQSGDPDFNTVKAVGTVGPLLNDIRGASESEKQQKHNENLEKAWRDMMEGTQKNIKHLLGEIGMKIGQASRSPACQQLDQIIAIMAVWLEQLMKP